MLGTRAIEKREFFRRSPILVTGATGLLGSHLSLALVEMGASCVSLVRDRPPRSPFFLWELEDRTTVVRGDVRDGKLLQRILTEYEIEVVFHLAAQTIVGHARENPEETIATNVLGTAALLEAVRVAGRSIRVVLASSDKAYGVHPTLPYTEDMPLIPVHPYDVSKAAAEMVGRSFALTYGMPVATTRCGNLYGAGDLNWNRLIPGTIRSVLRGERPIVRSNGTLVRDYLYVKDAVVGYLNLAFALGDPDLWGEAFNFSNEDPRDVLSVVSEILALERRDDLRPEILGGAADEIPAQHLSARKARERLGFAARLSLTEGLRETVDWYRSYLA